MNQSIALAKTTILPKSAQRIKIRLGFLIIALILVLLPMEWIILPNSIRLVDGVFMILLVYGLASFVTKKQKLFIPLILPMWLVIVASLFATLTGLLIIDSIIAITQEIYLFICFIVLINVLKTLPRSDFDRLIKIWSIVAVIEATTTLMGMLRMGLPMFYTSPIKDNVLSTGEFARGFGTFSNPNAGGAYLAISLFVLLAARWPKWLRIILGLYIFAGIFSTGSMAAVISSLIALTALFIVRTMLLKRKAILMRTSFLLAGLSLLLLLVFVVSQLLPLSSLPLSKNNNAVVALTLGRLNQSYSSRVNIVETSWAVYSHYPFGLGPNTSVLFSETMHNDYIAFLFERGPLGFIGWLWLVIATLALPSWKASRHIDKVGFWQISALWAGFLALAIVAFTHEVSHFRQFWTLMAFLYAANAMFFVPRSQILPKSL